MVPGRAPRRDAASSVAPVSSGYERSLRPCLALADRAPAPSDHPEGGSLTEPVEPGVETVEPRMASIAGPVQPREITPELARRNVMLGLAMLGVFLVLFAGTVVVALIYLAVVD